MKYNPEMNRCRGVDPRLLGQMLGSKSPIEADYTPCDRRANGNNRAGCSCGGRVGSTGRGGCACGERGGMTPRVGGCGERGGVNARNEQTFTCGGELASACAGDPSLAMVYSPHQSFDGLYSTEEALERGTLFVELDKPWKVGGCR